MKHLGFNEKTAEHIPSNLNESELGRIIAEHKERYVLQSSEKTYNAEITGNLRYSAQSRSDFPAVGDWVRFTPMDEQTAIIIELFPRYSALTRQAPGKQGELQIIASNIDVAFIVMAVGHDFNLKRLERYLTICNNADIRPLVVITKIDLIPETEIQQLLQQISNRIKNVPTFAISNETGIGYTQLMEFMQASKSYCFIGSSGVGKSTIVNRLLKEPLLKTNSISSSTQKGKHTTSHRELFILPNGSIVVDTPGMRELGITDQANGLERTYDDINELSKHCRFSNCTHSIEQGCAVLEAIENGKLTEDVYNNYMKLKREQEHFSSTVQEKRQQDKTFGKMVKSVMNHKNKQRY